MTTNDLKLYARYVAWCAIVEVTPMPIAAWMTFGSRLWHRHEIEEVGLAGVSA